ncbi:hypothetical protein SAMN05443432_101329 [Roseovarius litoreus]|uniref:Tripartite ATP-independent transporter, DctQ component n=1 Tax=Roseovarius litoreus TaxID=1155722 RepID=A0A1M7A7G2_9RHOB|nr:hypothetical protein SAMN05443432_101329 [Roseovarius litoreus]
MCCTQGYGQGVGVSGEWLKTAVLLLRFLVDIAVGIFFLVLIGIAALLIGKFVKWLESFDVVPAPVIKGLTFLEYGLFAVDVVCFAFLVVMAGYKLMVEIWREYK